MDEYPDGYGFAGDPFRTSDIELARSMAEHMDRTDPLPCRGHGDWVELTQWGNLTPVFMCGRCGERQAEDPYLEH